MGGGSAGRLPPGARFVVPTHPPPPPPPHPPVTKDDSVWIVEVFAEWCGHCKSLAPVYKEVAKALKGVVKVGALDAGGDAGKATAGKLGVKGFPTIFIYGADKNKPVEYSGARDAKSIVEAATKEVAAMIGKRMNGGKAGGSSGGGDKGKAEKKKAPTKPAAGSSGGDEEEDGVLVLTDDNFEAMVAKYSPLMVSFTAPWWCVAFGGWMRLW